MEKKTMGSFISALRRANGITQQELSERLGVTNKAVSRWERDENAPDISLLPAIAEIFGITTDELLSGERKKDFEISETELSKRSEKESEALAAQVIYRMKRNSFISAGILFAGIVLMWLLRGMDNERLGFGLAVMCCAGALILMAMSFSRARLALSNAISKKHVKKLYDMLFWIVAALMTAVTIIFVTFTDNTTAAADPMKIALILFSAGILSVTAGVIINEAMIGREELTDTAKKAVRHNEKLRLIMMAAVLAAAFITQLMSDNVFRVPDVRPSVSFGSFAEFVPYIEEPVAVDEDGQPITINDDNGNTTFEKSDSAYGLHDSHVDANGKRYDYTIRNMFVSGWNEDENGTVSVLTMADQQKQDDLFTARGILLCIAFAAECAVAIIIYARLRKKIIL